MSTIYLCRYLKSPLAGLYCLISAAALTSSHHIEKGQIKSFNFSFLGWGLKVTYNSDFFEKLRPPPWVFKCPNLNFRLFCFFSDPPPYWGKRPKFSRFLIMMPPLSIGIGIGIGISISISSIGIGNIGIGSIGINTLFLFKNQISNINMVGGLNTRLFSKCRGRRE